MKKYILSALAAFTLFSCTEDVMDDINKRPDNPSDENVAPSMQISDGIMSVGYNTTSGNIAFYMASYTEQLVGVGYAQLYNAEMRQPSMVASSSTFNNEWNGTYGNILNLKKAIAKSEDGAKFASQVDVRGMAKVMLALSYGNLTDVFGDIPAMESGKDRVKKPKVDSQSDIYVEIFRLLDSALDDFATAKANNLFCAGDQDVLFKGDLAKWESFVYALKARYKLHLIKVEPNAATEALAAAEKAKSLGFDGADIKGFKSYASMSSNPWAAFWGDTQYHASSKTVNDLLLERNDPRQPVYATPWAYNGKVLAADVATPGNRKDSQMVFGTSEGEGFSVPAWLNVYSFDEGEAGSIHLLSKSELFFILAELKIRAKQDYKEDFTTAVAASFDDYSKFGVAVNGSANDYVASLESRLNANAMKEIMIQKYISQCRDEQIEAYNDMRRFDALGESEYYVEKTNTNNKQNGANRWPLRMPYGQSDVIANPEVSNRYGDGFYIFTENVWWAGGRR